jgi:hypothetical protein
MELDLKCLFGHMHSRTHWLRPRNLPPHRIRGGILVSQNRRHLFMTPGPNSLRDLQSSAMREAAAGNTGAEHIINYPKNY